MDNSFIFMERKNTILEYTLAWRETYDISYESFFNVRIGEIVFETRLFK